MKLSLVVPCYNEADNVALFQQAVISAFDGCGYDYEIVFIDDGSRDATLYNLKKLYAAQECPVKVVSFSRNFGKEAGIYAGLQHAAGDYICLIDADLQQRPEIVRNMVKILDEEPEFDVVAAFQDRRGEGKVLSFFKKCFYSIINKLSKVTLQPDASDFRTFRRSVRDSILELAEYHRFSKGIFAWVGNTLGRRWGFAALFFQWFQITVGFVTMAFFILAGSSCSISSSVHSELSRKVPPSLMPSVTS